MKDKKYKSWLQNYSVIDKKTGLQRYSLTWVQIKEIIDEELDFAKQKENKDEND
jgi:hypothetical protein